MRDELSPGLTKAGKAVRDFTSTSKEATDELKASVQAQKEHVASLEAEVKKLEEAFKNAAPGNEWFEARNKLESVKTQLIEERDILEELIDKERELGEAATSEREEESDATEKVNRILMGLLGGQEKYKKVMEGMPAPIQAAANSISGMTGAARAFIATPLGVILAAIILAVKALSSWFTSSAEGQMEFARTSGYLSGILGQLKEIVIAVGKAIHKAFTDPKQAISDLWEHIKENFINRIEGLAGVIENFGKGLWNTLNLDFDAAGDSFKQMGNDILKVATGIDDLAGKTKDWLSQTHEAAKATGEIKAGELQLHRDRREWNIEREKMDQRISELRLKAQRGDAAANKEAEHLIREKYDREISYQQRELDLIKQKNSLTTNTEEDYDNEAEAERKLIALQKERNRELSFFNRKDFTLGNQAESAAARELAAQIKLSQELTELRRQNDAAEIEAMEEGLQKKLRLIDNEYEARKNAIEKQKNDWKSENVKAGTGNSLNGDQQAAIDEAGQLNEAKRQKAIAETYRTEFALMQEHLKQYGTYQQQKLAIASEYAEKIRKAGSGTEKQVLERERDSALAGVKVSKIRSTIDWSVVFGEFGGMFSKVMSPVLKDARSYTQTDEFRNSDQASQREVLDLIKQMERSLGEADKVSFARLGTELNAYQEASAKLRDAQEEYARTYKDLEKAQKEYATVQASGTEAEKEAAQIALESAQQAEDAAARNVESLQANADAAQRAVSDTAVTLKNSMDGVVDGLRQLASGSISGAYNGLITLGKNAREIGGVLGDAFGKVADTLEDIPIVGWIVSIIDIFKDGLSVVVDSLLDAVFDAVSGILDDVLSGNLVLSVGKSIINGVGKIFDAITWGGFTSWFGGGDSDKTLARDMEYLTASNKDLQKSIDSLAERMEEGSIADAKDILKQQEARLMEQEANTRQTMQRAGDAYSNGFLGIGGQHSSNYKVDRNMSGNDWRRISDIVGEDISHAWQFFNLTSEQMAKVLELAPDLYTKIKSYASAGYADAGQYMDEYIEYYKQYSELTEKFQEKVTGTSFSGLRDTFKSELLDMESDAESAGKNIVRALFENSVESLISGKYEKQLKEWYKRYADAMSNDGKLDEKELDDLKESYRKIVDDAIAERNALANAMNYNPEDSGTTQSGRAGSFNVMSQDQGTKLEGLFTSAEIHLVSIDEKMDDVSEKMSQAADNLRKIEENTKRTADKVEEISDNIEKIIRDGIKI